MKKVLAVRKRVFRFLYQARIEEPKAYYCDDDLSHFGDESLVKAALNFGRELGFIRHFRGCVQLTARGMIYVEKGFDDNGTSDER